MAVYCPLSDNKRECNVLCAWHDPNNTFAHCRIVASLASISTNLYSILNAVTGKKAGYNTKKYTPEAAKTDDEVW